MKEKVKAYVSVWNHGDTLALKSLLTEQSQYWDAMQEGSALRHLTDSISSIHKGFPDVTFKILSLDCPATNRYFLEWQMTGTNTGEFLESPPTGREILIRGLDSITLQLDRIVENQKFL